MGYVALIRDDKCIGVYNYYDENDLRHDETLIQLDPGQENESLVGKKYINGYFIDEFTKQDEQEKTNSRNRMFLNQTDWLVTRHRDQLDMGGTTSLSPEEFQELLQLRDRARSLVKNEVQE